MILRTLPLQAILQILFLARMLRKVPEATRQPVQETTQLQALEVTRQLDQEATQEIAQETTDKATPLRQ
jgi:hypothetical protein